MNMKNTFLQFAVIVFVSFAFISSVEAATFTVNTTLDTVDAIPGDGVCLDLSGFCSLRAATMEINITPINTNHGINLPAGTYTLTIVNSSPGADIVKGDLNFTDHRVSIIGSNPRTTIIQAGTVKSTTAFDGNGIDRVFGIKGISPDITRVDFRGVTIRNGRTGSTGGGILATGDSLGGVIVVNFIDVTIADNRANGGGGFYCSGCVSTIENTTITDNIGIFGTTGGIAAASQFPNSIRLTNTTISGNNQGVAFQTGSHNITNCTITNNKESFFAFTGVAGVTVSGTATTNIRNTIIANNFKGESLATPSDVSGIFTSAGTNLIGSVGTSTGWIGSDLLNNTSANLGPLANNGGQTDTHSIPSTSSALNAGQNCVVNSTCGIFSVGSITTDQRGQNRLVNGFAPTALFVDIGAYEKQIPTVASANISGRVTTATGRGIRNVGVTVTKPNGETLFAITNPFGYYRFQELPVGETYILSVNSKRYSFAEPTRVISLSEDLTDADFVSDGK